MPTNKVKTSITPIVGVKKHSELKYTPNLTGLAGKLAARSQEIRAVGAWVLPENQLCNHDAVSSAQNEEIKMQRLQQQKEARLKQFQEDVKRRVLAIDRMKRRQQLDRSQRAASAECKILSQSGEMLTPTKDRCSIRVEDELHISGLLTSQPGLLLHSSAENQVPRIELHREQVHKLHSLARKSLATCQIFSNHYEPDDLPGGIWRQGPTLDEKGFTDEHFPDAKPGKFAWVISANQPNRPVSRKPDDRFVASADNPVIEKEVIDKVQRQMVRFDVEPQSEETRENRIAKKSVNVLCGTEVNRAPAVPVLHPAVESEEERVRARQQLAMYRRLFMDIERQQIRDNIRQRNHRMKMASLKKQKEEDRGRVEGDLSRPITDPVTGLTLEQSQTSESVEHELSLQACQAAEHKQRKRRETERFLEALKRNLREKIEKQNLDVPQLCCCAPTIWDTNPETCANNCIFYKNPKGYAKALQSILSSCDL